VDTKTLISETDRVRVWEFRNANGDLVSTTVEPIPTAEESNAATLRGLAATALAANATYLAIGSPSAAQVAAQVRLLTRESTALIRLALGLLDSTDGT
jgi:hypothetical protein